MKVFLSLSSAVVVVSQYVGGYKDVHGCVPSTGYQWCESSQKCLRVLKEECPTTTQAATNHLTGSYRDTHGCLPSGGYQWCESSQKCYRDFEEDCPKTTTPELLGGYKDAHGCVPSAGYQWCASSQTCFRLFEESCTTTTAAPRTSSGEAASDVPKSCILWHDGCNSCLANNRLLTGCTEMYCLKKGPAYCSHYRDGMKCTGVHACSPPHDCTSFYDGCNSCGAQNGRTTFCTMMYCSSQYTHQPYCRAFKNGRECQGLDNCNTDIVVVQG